MRLRRCCPLARIASLQSEPGLSAMLLARYELERRDGKLRVADEPYLGFLK